MRLGGGGKVAKTAGPGSSTKNLSAHPRQLKRKNANEGSAKSGMTELPCAKRIAIVDLKAFNWKTRFCSTDEVERTCSRRAEAPRWWNSQELEGQRHEGETRNGQQRTNGWKNKKKDNFYKVMKFVSNMSNGPDRGVDRTNQTNCGRGGGHRDHMVTLINGHTKPQRVFFWG